MIRVFVSYSEKNKDLAGCIKSLLRPCKIDVFLAHHDIVGSKKWVRTIQRNIRRAHFVALLVTDNFISSSWTDQETGYAVALKKPIIPICFKAHMPYGFVSEYQAIKLSNDDCHEAAAAIFKTILKTRSLTNSVRRAIVRGFCGSKDFSLAKFYKRCFESYPKHNTNELRKIYRATLVNDQIAFGTGYGEVRDFVEGIYKRLRKQIPTR